ncbi:unnamed protein product [Symbiodinium natans]|uniref:Uncharacterized protein n=1 Tax=Symbiodinium natans TaxID=878477 RepID=A0A812S1I3_9DINO|nr:unnamed protein product [Symbiodinium natans]
MTSHIISQRIGWLLENEGDKPCEEIWAEAVSQSTGSESPHHHCPAWAGKGNAAWRNGIFRECWDVIRACGHTMGVVTCTPSLSAATEVKASAKHGKALPPVCGRMPVVPSWGSVTERLASGEMVPRLPLPKFPKSVVGSFSQALHCHSVNVMKVDDAWDFQLQETPCRMGVREASHMESCLAGSWIVIIGASQASVWTQQFANLLAPGALDSRRDGFVSDGVYLHAVDLVIEKGKVVHKVVEFEGGHLLEDHRGAHSDAHDAIEMPQTYARLAEAPPYNRSSGQIRLTHLIAEFWDEAETALVALDLISPGGWKKSPMFLIMGVGLWYGYAKGCALDWCATRPSIAGLDLESILEMFTAGLRRMGEKLQTFCTSGRAAVHGCTVMSIEYCSELYQNTVYVHLHQAMKRGIKPYVSDKIRYFDLWEFLEQVPEDCLFGHMSPASTSFLIQALLDGVCPANDVADATLIAFVGKACRSRQIVPDCPGISCGGYMYTWDFALAQNCKLVAAVDPVLEEKGYQPIMAGPALAAPWMLRASAQATQAK